MAGRTMIASMGAESCLAAVAAASSASSPCLNHLIAPPLGRGHCPPITLLPESATHERRCPDAT
jgi:hypothetical protein